MRLFGLKFYNKTFREVIEDINGYIEDGIKITAYTPNVDHIVKIHKIKEFNQAYRDADLILNDSKVLFFVSRILRKSLKDKISGSDLLPALCEMAAENGYGVFFLGGRDNSSYYAAEKIKKIYPEINISGTYSPQMGFEKNSGENKKILKMINDLKPHILFVGVGTPKQEIWIYKNKAKLNALFLIGVGASFEFTSGMIKRAPKWIQNLAMEWMYRLIREPRRLWQRYLVDDLFFFRLLIREFFKRKK